MTTDYSSFFAEHYLKQFGLYNFSKHYNGRYYGSEYPLNKPSQQANLPLIFPRVEAFLCSTELFSWAVEAYDVEGEGTNTDLINKKTYTFLVRGLGIPGQESKTITIKDNCEQGINYDGGIYPTGTAYYAINDDVPIQLNGEREREVYIEGTDLGIPDIEDIPESDEYYSFYKVNKIPHGQLLDMAIYIKD